MEVEGKLLEDVFIVDVDNPNDPNTLKTDYLDVAGYATAIVSYEDYRQKQENTALTKTFDSE